MPLLALLGVCITLSNAQRASTRAASTPAGAQGWSPRWALLALAAARKAAPIRRVRHRPVKALGSEAPQDGQRQRLLRQAELRATARLVVLEKASRAHVAAAVLSAAVASAAQSHEMHHALAICARRVAFKREQQATTLSHKQRRKPRGGVAAPSGAWGRCAAASGTHRTSGSRPRRAESADSGRSARRRRRPRAAACRPRAAKAETPRAPPARSCLPTPGCAGSATPTQACSAAAQAARAVATRWRSRGAPGRGVGCARGPRRIATRQAAWRLERAAQLHAESRRPSVRRHARSHDVDDSVPTER